MKVHIIGRNLVALNATKRLDTRMTINQ